MKLLRSWPATPPAGRAHVVDGLERLVMDDYDYRCLGQVGGDVLLLEWDVAVDRDGLEAFRSQIVPGDVLVAPYRLYESQHFQLPQPVWAHRVYDGDHLRHVTEGDETADLWGMGMVYLPWAFLSAFLADYDGHVSDGSLSGWHHRRHGPVRIAWDVRPAHLHYTLREG